MDIQRPVLGMLTAFILLTPEFLSAGGGDENEGIATSRPRRETRPPLRVRNGLTQMELKKAIEAGTQWKYVDKEGKEIPAPLPIEPVVVSPAAPPPSSPVDPSVGFGAYGPFLVSTRPEAPAEPTGLEIMLSSLWEEEDSEVSMYMAGVLDNKQGAREHWDVSSALAFSLDPSRVEAASFEDLFESEYISPLSSDGSPDGIEFAEDGAWGADDEEVALLTAVAEIPAPAVGTKRTREGIDGPEDVVAAERFFESIWKALPPAKRQKGYDGLR